MPFVYLKRNRSGELERLITQKDLDAVFLEMDVFNLTPESCIAFLDPMIVSWDINVLSFSIQIELNRKITHDHFKRYEFVATTRSTSAVMTQAWRSSSKILLLARDVSSEEVEFLRRLRFEDERQPTILFYYRALPNLRDPLHFRQKPK